MDFLFSLFSLIIWWLPLLALGYMLYTTDFFRVAYTRGKIAYQSLTALKNLIATRHKNPVKIIIHTVITLVKTCGTMIFKICWINFLQYINNSVVQEGRVFCVTYAIKGKLYKIKVIPERGPEKIMQIIDDAYNDVTEEISPYLRAQQTMIHHFTPKDFGKENIQILTADEDDPFNFNEDEKIILTGEEVKLGSLSNPVLNFNETPKNTEIPEPMQNIMNGVMSLLEGLQRPPKQNSPIQQKTE